MSKFQRLRFKIHELPKEADVLEAFPELKRYNTIAKSKYPMLNLVLRYIIYLYDPGTDLNYDIPDLPNRKRAAALLAGFEHETPELQRLMDMKEPKFVDLIHCFLTQVYRNREYTEWCTLQQELDESTRLRMKSLDSDTEDNEEELDLFKAHDLKSKSRKSAAEIHEKLDLLEPKIFGGDSQLLDIATQSRYLSPESWSKVLTE